LRRIPQEPEDPRGIDPTANAQILGHTEYWQPALVWRIEGDAFLQVLAGSRQRAKPEPRRPKGIVGDDRERRVVGTVGQAQQRVPDLAGRLQLWPYNITSPQTKQDLGKLWCLAHLLTQGVCLGIGVFDLGRGVPFGHQQCRAEGDVEGDANCKKKLNK